MPSQLLLLSCGSVDGGSILFTGSRDTAFLLQFKRQRSQDIYQLAIQHGSRKDERPPNQRIFSTACEKSSCQHEKGQSSHCTKESCSCEAGSIAKGQSCDIILLLTSYSTPYRISQLKSINLLKIKWSLRRQLGN